jgi:hypothetical protein
MIPAPVTPPPMTNTSVSMVVLPVPSGLPMIVGVIILLPCHGKNSFTGFLENV